jgi:hypothetical protein
MLAYPYKVQVKVIVIVIRSYPGDEPVKKSSFGLHGLTRSTRKIKEINIKFISSFFPILPTCIHANHREELIEGKLFKGWKCQLHVASTPLLHAYKHTKTWYKLKKKKKTRKLILGRT